MKLVQRDLNSIWHPCSQMKDYEAFPPIEIAATEGSYLITTQGQRIIDANSSWWCKSLGHQHPRLKEALIKQAETYDHVISANTCQEPLVQLSETLLKLIPGFSKVFYASDGSSAVEIALKLSLHTRQLQGQKSKTKIMALANGYHGETILTLSVSDLGLYKEAYCPWLQQTLLIKDIPYVYSTAANLPEMFLQNNEETGDPHIKEYIKTQLYAQHLDFQGDANRNEHRSLQLVNEHASEVYNKPENLSVKSIQKTLWSDCSTIWPKTEAYIREHADELTAIIVEPIVQGAGGMQVYSADFLKRLRMLTKELDIHLIADEIMTGFFRTGKLMACEHSDITPDFICLGKGLNGGWLPLSAVLIPETIYHAFYGDYHKGHNFLHSNTHSGNILAAAVALECLAIYQETDFQQHLLQLEHHLQKEMRELVDKGLLINFRHIGAIAAADLNPQIFDYHSRPGFRIFQKAVDYGALLRPLGNTIYWLPPLNTPLATLTELKEITERALRDQSK